MRMISCDECYKEESSIWRRGGSSGLPSGWISLVGVTHEEDENVDSVNPSYSGKFCSHNCLVKNIDSQYSNSLYKLHSVKPKGIDNREEIVETREMQSTRIGLTVLDVLHALLNSEASEDYGALIPLSEDYEGLPHTCVLTVAKVIEVDVPEAFQQIEGDDV